LTVHGQMTKYGQRLRRKVPISLNKVQICYMSGGADWVLDCLSIGGKERSQETTT